MSLRAEAPAPARAGLPLAALALVAATPIWGTAVYSAALLLLLAAWLATAAWRRGAWRSPLAVGGLLLMSGIGLAALAAPDGAAAWEEFRSYYPFLLLILAADAVRGAADLRLVGVSFLASTAVAAAAAFGQALGLVAWQDSRFRGLVGIFEYAAGMVLAWSVCVWFFLHLRSRWGCAGLYALSLLYLQAIGLNATRASLVALACALLLLAWFGRAHWRKLLLLLAPLAIAAPLVMRSELGARLGTTETAWSMQDPQTQRQVIWAYAWTMFQSEPALGVGPGGFTRACAELKRDPRLARWPRLKHPYKTAHSVPLHLMATSGLVGLAGFLAWAGITAVHLVRAARRNALFAAPALAVFAAVLAFGATDMSLLNTRISGLLCLALGACAGALRAAAAAERPPPGRESAP